MMFTRKKYLELADNLKLNFGSDEKARDILDSLVDNSKFDDVEKLIKGGVVFVFGCGPSLKEDIEKFKEINLSSNAVLIAADGAVKALLEQGIVPQLCVTDLDGNTESLKQANKRGCIMVVHAHGDNIQAVKRIVPELSGKKLGTTQVKPTEKIRNFGGFTDGDRAVHLAVHFQAKKIVLFGMDFGKDVGEYSGKTKDSETKIRKLEIGKHLLEEVAGRTKIPILNLTERGEYIKNTIRASISDLEGKQ